MIFKKCLPYCRKFEMKEKITKSDYLNVCFFFNLFFSKENLRNIDIVRSSKEIKILLIVFDRRETVQCILMNHEK